MLPERLMTKPPQTMKLLPFFKLWLIVTGAPTEHVNHVWDNTPNNDENFPYKVKFINTSIQ